MAAADQKPVLSEAEASGQRRLEAMHLQEIENNPLDPSQIAMFEMFEREGWSHERRRAYLHQLYSAGVSHAAE